MPLIVILADTTWLINFPTPLVEALYVADWVLDETPDLIVDVDAVSFLYIADWT